MKIFTSYFANIKNMVDEIPISVALWTPNDIDIIKYGELAPTSKILNYYKKYGNEKQYEIMYNEEVLSELNPHKVVEDLRYLSNGKDVALICYEGKSKFCHRHLIAKWLKNNGYEVTEWEKDNTGDITHFRGEYAFLSNFQDCEVYLDGMKFPSVENAYQAAKAPDIENRRKFQTMSAIEAKNYSKYITNIPIDWNEKRLALMENLVFQKFNNNERLKELLLNTGNRQIIEGNYWHDTFWGICNGVGENNLGKIIMKVRDELRQKK